MSTQPSLFLQPPKILWYVREAQVRNFALANDALDSNDVVLKRRQRRRRAIKRSEGGLHQKGFQGDRSFFNRFFHCCHSCCIFPPLRFTEVERSEARVVVLLHRSTLLLQLIEELDTVRVVCRNRAAATGNWNDDVWR